MAPRAEASRRGFTLVEVMVSMLLLSIVAVSLASFISVTARSSRLAESRASAALVARQELDRLKATPFDRLRVGSSSEKESVEGRVFRVVSIVQQPRPELKTVIVSVSEWRGEQELQRLRSAVYDWSGM
jgi:prepilin-type N-terminal cleavage/methylation domain-containing protein